MALDEFGLRFAVSQIAANRHLTRPEVVTALEACPQFGRGRAPRRLVDRIGYGDEAQANAKARAAMVRKTIAFNDYGQDSISGLGEANIAWSRQPARFAMAPISRPGSMPPTGICQR